MFTGLFLIVWEKIGDRYVPKWVDRYSNLKKTPKIDMARQIKVSLSF